MPITEIDAIFASTSKPPQVEVISSRVKGNANAALVSEGTNLSGRKRKKKKEKSKLTTDNDNNNLSQPSLQGTITSVKRRRAEPETIIDPSAPTKRSRSAGVAGAEETSSRKTKRKTTDHDHECLEKFRDSRGTAPRRKTEDGFSIYKEDELGIGDRGGDTPLCPFDCKCCF